MSDFKDAAFGAGHDHIFLGAGHEKNERNTWAVIGLCSAMMLVEIVGGSMFGSLALVADGLHMSTHAGAMLIAALAYTYARKHATDSRFVFGTGKLGDLAGFTSAIVLAMIAVLIGYEAVPRFLSPVPIYFGEAIPIAAVGLLVNLASVWLLSGGDHGHSHGHSHGHDEHAREDEMKKIFAQSGVFAVSIFEDGVPPVFRITPATANSRLDLSSLSVKTVRIDGTQQVFAFADCGGYLESKEDVPEPHAFKAIVRMPDGEHEVEFEEHGHDTHDAATRDHNIRSAYIHVMADAAVSVLAILLDMSPDRRVAENVRHAIEDRGDKVVDLHLWRVGPGHISAVVSVATSESQRDSRFYHAVLGRFKELSHVTVEVQVTPMVA